MIEQKYARREVNLILLKLKVKYIDAGYIKTVSQQVKQAVSIGGIWL
jgi:hypothetical protein